MICFRIGPLDNNLSDQAPGGVSNDNGSWVGTPAYASSMFGQGIDLSGSNYVSIPTSSDLVHNSSDLSISVWFKVDNFNRGWQAVVSKGEGSNYRIARDRSRNSLAYAGGASDITGGSVNDGAWHHALAVTEVGEGTFLYIDGVEEASAAGSPNLSDGGFDLLLGSNPQQLGRTWDGQIDDVGIFSRPLTSFDAAAIHELGTDPNYSYTLDQVVEVLDAHEAGPGSSVTVAGTSWQYAASDPGSGSGFIVLASDGSGIAPGGGPAISSFFSTPIFIDSGESATLSWQVDPSFTSVTIDQGVGNVTSATSSGRCRDDCRLPDCDDVLHAVRQQYRWDDDSEHDGVC